MTAAAGPIAERSRAPRNACAMVAKPQLLLLLFTVVGLARAFQGSGALQVGLGGRAPRAPPRRRAANLKWGPAAAPPEDRAAR